MFDADVIVVGGGLTGLRAAYELVRGGASVLVIERQASVGGRLQTTFLDGFTLDHGFQVLLSSYPEVQALSGIDTLHLKSFTPGARIKLPSGEFELLDWRSGVRGLLTLFHAPFFTTRDLLRLGLFSLLAPRSAPQLTSTTTAKDIIQLGFSNAAVTSFLKPFLSGVLLDTSLGLDSGLARFYMGMFSRGVATLPERGMQALPELLCSGIGKSHILLSTQVTQISPREVVLASGETLSARHVLCATDGLSAAELGAAVQTLPYGGCTTLYFQSPEAPFKEPLLYLNGTGFGLVNHLAVLSNVQPSYAPQGKALISATVVGSPSLRGSALVEGVLKELTTWFGEQVAAWQHLSSFEIPSAIPLRPRFAAGWSAKDNVFFAGDYLSYGSQNGALAAGRAVARVILEELDGFG